MTTITRSPFFAAVKKYYDEGHAKYTNETLKGFVKTKMITATEYEEITGVLYEA